MAICFRPSRFYFASAIKFLPVWRDVFAIWRDVFALATMFSPYSHNSSQRTWAPKQLQLHAFCIIDVACHAYTQTTFLLTQLEPDFDGHFYVIYVFVMEKKLLVNGHVHVRRWMVQWTTWWRKRETLTYLVDTISFRANVSCERIISHNVYTLL